jgi:hypothetical protein
MILAGVEFIAGVRMTAGVRNITGAIRESDKQTVRRN